MAEFDYRQRQDFSLFHSVQTDSVGHQASYPMGIGGDFPGGKATGAGVKLTTHRHLVPRSRIVEIYLHSPICLGIVLN
jgi:hypothetical protein